MSFPLDTLGLGNPITLFRGPEYNVNYVGTSAASCTITTTGTAAIDVALNTTPMPWNSSYIPNPNSWRIIQTITYSGTISVDLTPRSNPNWIRLSIHTPGTGTCEVTPIWQTLGSVIDPFRFRGYWDAAANDPTITSGSGPIGGYYIVNIPGTTSIDGISSWAVGDIIAFNRTAWIKQKAGPTVQNP